MFSPSLTFCFTIVQIAIWCLFYLWSHGRGGGGGRGVILGPQCNQVVPILAQKLEHILRCLISSEFFWQINMSPCPKHFFKNAMGIFFILYIKKFHKNRTVIMKYFMRKVLSELILDLRKCPNQKMHQHESAGFTQILIGALPEVQNQLLKKKLLIKFYIFTVMWIFRICKSFGISKYFWVIF